MSIDYQEAVHFSLTPVSIRIFTLGALQKELEGTEHITLLSLVDSATAAQHTELEYATEQDIAQNTPSANIAFKADSASDKALILLRDALQDADAKAERSGHEPPFPNLTREFFPVSLTKITRKTRKDQLIHNARILKVAEDPEVRTYLGTLGVVPILTKLAESNQKLQNKLLEHTLDESVTLRAAARANAKSLYFQVCTAVVGMKCMGIGGAAEMVSRIWHDNDEYLAYRRRHLANNATPEEEVAVDLAYVEEALPPEM